MQVVKDKKPPIAFAPAVSPAKIRVAFTPAMLYDTPIWTEARCRLLGRPLSSDVDFIVFSIRTKSKIILHFAQVVKKIPASTALSTAILSPCTVSYIP